MTSRRPVLLLVLGLVLVLAAGGTAAWLARREAPAPVTVGDPGPQLAGPEQPGAGRTVLVAPAGASGRCLPLDAGWLADVEVAVGGTVTGTDDGTVTLEAERWWAGDPTTEVVLQDASALAGLLGGVPEPEVGERWLVAGSGGRVAVCGATGPWTEDLEDAYAEAFS